MSKVQPKYIIEYIQVNINVGDCEIILLLEEKNGKRCIKHSVMIDGGKGSRILLQNIGQVFKRIGQKYNKKQFKLDVMVISHWDEDHYGGILKYLRIESEKNGEVPFLKYKGGVPESTLYIPYKKYGTVGRRNIVYSGTGNTGEFGFAGAERICKYHADIDIPDSTLEELLKRDPLAWNGSDPNHKSELIGRNLFIGKRPDLEDMKLATNPENLVNIHQPDAPGLYCVAANNRYLKGSSSKSGNAITSTERNRGSIVCMIIHPDSTVSHYLAGDAFQNIEEKIMGWTGFEIMSTPLDNVSDKDRIAIVKASHHGGATSTPVTMCQTYKPKHFVFSAGKMHGHPTWAVLLYVCAYYEWLGKPDQDKISLTSFPHWMKDIEKFSVNLKDGAMNAYLDQIKEFVPKKAKKFEKTSNKSKWIFDNIKATLLKYSHVTPQYEVFPSKDMELFLGGDNVSSISFVLGDNEPVQLDFYDVAFHQLKSQSVAEKPSPSPGRPKRSGKKRVVASTISEGDNAGKRFYLMSYAVDPGTGPCIRVPKQWDPFVTALTCGYITLADELQSTTQTVHLDDEADEWQVWLASAISPAPGIPVQISMTGSVTGEKLAIENFSLTISVKSSSLLFSPARKIGPKNDDPFDPMTDFLRFDLADSSVGSTISFGDLVKFSGISIGSITFGSDIDLKLEKGSAVWFSPLLGDYTCTLRLQAKAVLKPDKGVASFLKNFSDLGLWDETAPLSVIVVAKKTTTSSSWKPPATNINQLQLLLSFDFPLFSTTISYGEKSYTLVISWKNGASETIVKFLGDTTKSNAASNEFEVVQKKISSTFDVLRVLVEIDRGDKLSIRKISINAQLKFEINGVSSEKKDIFIMLSFVWPSFIFMGNLYVPDTLGDDWKKLMPSYEELLAVKPIIDPSTKTSNLSILDLIPGVTITKPPQGIPVLISHAAIEANPASFMLEGVLRAEAPSSGTAVPSVSFDTLELYLSYNWNDPKESLSLYVNALINLHPPPVGSTHPPREPKCTGDPSFLFASVEYAEEKWTLTGELRGINFGDLAIFFHKDEQSHLVDVLGNVTIRSVSVKSEYGNGEPSNFLFKGYIQIAELELDFTYTRDGREWSIEGGLSAATECTLGTIIKSICGDESAGFDIPDAIKDIKLNIPHDGPQPKPEKSPVYLKYSKPSSKDSPFVFLLRFKLDKAQFSFVQTSHQQSDKQSVKKRILVASLGNLLSSFKIPVIGKIDNPLDGLEFVWIHDKSQSMGLTKGEVANINAVAFKDQTGIVFKEPAASKSAADSDVVLTVGSHFMLLMNDSGKVTVALDYKFGFKTKDKKYKAIASPTSTAGDSSNDPGDDSNDEGGAPKVAAQKSVGPLFVSNIGLQYKDSKIFVILDATLTLGPIRLSLLGFGLGLKLSSTLFLNPQPSDFSVQLHGLAPVLNKPPIVLAGLFEDLTKGNDELFAGGVTISLKGYGFLALGSYGTIGGELKTVFLFAQLVGPLAELGFATINGVSLGFGYNSHVRLPNIDEVLSFPLVKGISGKAVDDATSSSNVLAILSSDVFTSWVTPRSDSYWFAVGLQVLAFETLDVRAVAIVEVDPHISIGLFADAVFSLPPARPREKCYVYVELGIASRVDIESGTFSIDGKLSPNSFILHPSCHLLGGFALYYWFDPSPYAGDFVFTIGGYHPAYRPPSHYPRPQRLSISWQLDSNLSITGDSFFAITPKVCMGGGSLSIVFQKGGFRAHFNAHAEFLMAWNPFYFIGDIGVSVGVGYNGKVLFWSVCIEVDISASLHLEGPPFGGNVYVDFWLFAVDIYFGSRPAPPKPLSLEEFWDLLARSSNKPNSGVDPGITLVVESGYAQGKSKQVTPKPGEPWIITAGQFKFNIQCRFTLHAVRYMSKLRCESRVPVHSKPMHTTKPIESILEVTIQTRVKSEAVEGFEFLPMTKNVPSATWGEYDPNNDPSQGGTPEALLDGNDSTIKDMLTGVYVKAPEPKYPKDHIPPFNVHEAMFVEILDGKKFPVVKSSPQAGAWLPKATDWKGAKDAWSKLETSKRVVDIWSRVFRWPVDNNIKLAGDPPLHLINELEHVYLDVPKITSS